MKRLINRVRLHASGLAERLTKSADVKAIALELLELWRAEVSSFRGCNFYMHIAYHHLPDFIARLPVDILQASGDSFEAKNQEMKRRLRRFDLHFNLEKIITHMQQKHKQTQGSVPHSAHPRGYCENQHYFTLCASAKMRMDVSVGWTTDGEGMQLGFLSTIAHRA